MGHIVLNDPSEARRLPTWKEQPAVLGIRLNIAGEQAAWLTQLVPAAILAQYEGVKPPKAISTNRMAIHR